MALDRKYGELHSHLQRLSVIRTVCMRLASALDPGEVLANMLDTIDELVSYEAAAVYLLDRNGDALGATDSLQRVYGEEVRPTLRVGRMASTGMPHAGTGTRAAEDSAVMEALNSQRTIARVTRDGNLELAVPLLAGARTRGALELRCAAPLGEGEVQLLEIFAASCAIAIRSTDLYQETQRLATTDALTGLSNHRHFRALLNLEVERARRMSYPVAVVMMAVDQFKQVNDSCGYAIGDIVLCRIAQVLRAHLRRMDVVARLGDATFAAILPNSSPEKLVIALERVRRAIEQLPPLQPEEAGMHMPTGVTLSYGGCALPPGMVNAEILLHRADLALREANRKGGNEGRLWVADSEHTPNHMEGTASAVFQS
jgi:diguanylate cyclase (GGDEF)-like protein